MKALELNGIFPLYDPLLTIILTTVYLIDDVILIKANDIYIKDQHNRSGFSSPPPHKCN